MLFSFLEQIKLVGFHIMEALPLPTRPRYLDGFSALRFAKAEVRSYIALRKIAASARNFANLRRRATHNADLGG